MSAKEEKKIWRKVSRSLLMVSKDENLEIKESDYQKRSQCLLIINAGLICFVSYEQLFEVFSSFGRIKEILLIPNKSYAFIEFFEQSKAENAFHSLNQNFCQQLNRKLNIAFISYEIFSKVFDKNKEKIERICSQFERKPLGLSLVNEFITEKEEEILLDFTKTLFENPKKMKNRLSKDFGYEFDYSLNRIKNKEKIERIPKELDFLLNRFKERELIEEIPDQLTINCYHPGNGIPSHIDTHSMCENLILCLSIGSHIVMHFQNPRNEQQLNVFLTSRSLLLMRDESRFLWKHSISSSKTDLIVLNEEKKKILTLNKRKTRISLTFRKVKTNQCECLFTEFCDSQQREELSEEHENQLLESEFVHKVYETIGSHFSETRYKAWPKVSQFLNSLSKGSLVLDIGCGNGKYMKENPNIMIMGCDRSETLLNICKDKGNEVFLCDCLQLSQIRCNSFDCIICVAVLHHLSSKERRIKALQSMIDLLVMNGKLLIYVWAFEQKKEGKKSQYLKKSEEKELKSERKANLLIHKNGTQFQSQELLVPWNSANNNPHERQLRYYHVFKEGELKELLLELKGARILDLYYDCGNYASILQRV